MKPDEFDTWEQKHLVSRVLNEMDSPFSRRDLVQMVKHRYPFITKDVVAEVLHSYCDSGYILFDEVEEGAWAYVPILKEDGFADNGMHTPSMFDENGQPVMEEFHALEVLSMPMN